MNLTLTAPGRFDEPLPAAHWLNSASAAAGSATAELIHIDEADVRQTILGFGAAFTDAACSLISRMKPEAQEKLLHEFFSADGMRLSAGRLCIGSSDYAREAYSYDDVREPDPEMKHFSIDHDRDAVLPVLRAALRINPELFLLAAPWSPPGWMKSGGSMMGGSMQKQAFAAYAQYFVRFLEAYKAEGVQVGAVTSQNEVDTDQEGKMPATLWGQEYETAFVKSFLGPALKSHGLNTEIWLLDHNYDLWGRVMDQLADPELAQYVSAVAWHGYYGSPTAMTDVHKAHPSKHACWTEGGPDYTAADYATDWAKWGTEFSGVLNNWSRTLLAWNLVLDERGKPKIGPFNCGGLFTLHSESGEITPSGQARALRVFSRTIARGARILGSNSQASGLAHVAAANPDGSFAVVISNRGPARSVAISFRKQTATLQLPADAIVSATWV